MEFGDSRGEAKGQARPSFGKKTAVFRASFTSSRGSSLDWLTVVGPPFSGLKQWQLAERGRWRGHRHGRESPRCRHGLKKATTPPPHTRRDKSRLAAQPRAILDLGNSSPKSHRSHSGKPAENRQESGDCHVPPCLRDPVTMAAAVPTALAKVFWRLLELRGINCQVIVFRGRAASGGF